MTSHINLSNDYQIKLKIHQIKHILKDQIKEDINSCIKEISMTCDTEIDSIQNDINLFIAMINNKCRKLELSDGLEPIENKSRTLKTIYRGVHFY